MTSVEDAFKTIPKRFEIRRLSTEEDQWLKSYKGIHRLESDRDVFNHMRKELEELKEKVNQTKQEMKPNGGVLEPLTLQERENDSEETTLELTPCVYASWNNPEQKLVDCGRLLSKKGKVITLRLEACVKCFERRTFIQKKKKEEQQSNDDFADAYGKGSRDWRDSQPLEKDPRPKFMQDHNLIYCALKACNRNRTTLDHDECSKCPNTCFIKQKTFELRL